MIRLIAFLQPFSKYLLIAWVITIVALSSTPSLPVLKIHTSNTEIRLDYLIHFIEYFSLTFLCFVTFGGEGFNTGLKMTLILTVSLFLFAIADEYHQKFIPGRTFNYKDMISNTTGVATGVIFCLLVLSIVRKAKR